VRTKADIVANLHTVARQLPLSPMRIFAVWVEHALPAERFRLPCDLHHKRQRGLKLRSKKPEFKVCEAVSDIFHLVSLEAKSIGHHRQTATQLPVALFQVVSNFATFEWCNCRVGDPPPSHPLPFLQLSYFET
jgi:hypothetical protein